MFREHLCLSMAQYFVNNQSTIRKTANHFNISKSSVHNYFHKKLSKLNYNLFEQVQSLLKKNQNEKHWRGGATTKLLYTKKKDAS